MVISFCSHLPLLSLIIKKKQFKHKHFVMAKRTTNLILESAKLCSLTFRQKLYTVLRTPMSPLSRHSSIGFHPKKINWFAKQIDSKALLRPNQPNCLYRSNTSGLIKSCKLHNIAVTIFVKCYPRMSFNNPLSGNWSLLCSASLHNKLPKQG